MSSYFEKKMYVTGMVDIYVSRGTFVLGGRESHGCEFQLSLTFSTAILSKSCRYVKDK